MIDRALLRWYHHYRGTVSDHTLPSKRSAHLTSASEALRSARIKIRFDELESQELVRLHTEPEYDFYDDSYIDTWTHTSEKAKEKAKQEISDRIDREGYWILIGQWRATDDDAWSDDFDNASIGGFIGDDYEDSGYDVDIMRATIEAYDNHLASEARKRDEQTTREACMLSHRATYAGVEVYP